MSDTTTHRGKADHLPESEVEVLDYEVDSPPAV